MNPKEHVLYCSPPPADHRQGHWTCNAGHQLSGLGLLSTALSPVCSLNYLETPQQACCPERRLRDQGVDKVGAGAQLPGDRTDGTPGAPGHVHRLTVNCWGLHRSVSTTAFPCGLLVLHAPSGCSESEQLSRSLWMAGPWGIPVKR